MNSNFNPINFGSQGSNKPAKGQSAAPVSPTEDMAKQEGSLQQKAEVSEMEKRQQALENVSQPDQTELNNALQDINTTVQSLQRELKFSQDDASGESIIQVLDIETDEVIRQFPPEYALKLAQALNNAKGNLGSIFSEKV